MSNRFRSYKAGQIYRRFEVSQSSTTVFTSPSEENLVPDKRSFSFGKGKWSLGHRETIRQKRPGMLSDVVILLHGNTHTARKTQEWLRKFKWEVWIHPPTAQIRHPIWVPNTYLEQGSLPRVM
ncbi:hypothetical protein AVEN_213893-1 [Araneus ventricosus]|uniref:Uncharacterized protein n=1 Tax=Araneus ventricosus TaxID=182803 RepID=A0A4Y2KF59_ARAVE|nr:hypothetical protein AVEN_213893-1 [Araneus ventricosus]